jgi:hypothetical protein
MVENTKAPPKHLTKEQYKHIPIHNVKSRLKAATSSILHHPDIMNINNDIRMPGRMGYSPCFEGHKTKEDAMASHGLSLKVLLKVLFCAPINASTLESHSSTLDTFIGHNTPLYILALHCWCRPGTAGLVENP